MRSGNENNSLEKLQQELGVIWDAIMKARRNAEDERKRLREALDSYDSEDTSIVVFGSLARDEFTSGSDVDWTLLVDGFANPEHLDDALEIEKHVNRTGKGPGREGTFSGLTFSHDLIHRIGGGDDTNRNTTQRILLLLESAAIGRADAHERVIRNILRRYINEDYGLTYSAGPFNVPRFLQNDIARYWRTVAVDFAYKQRQRADVGWALRAAKLRISRKLTYVSGLLMCFSCEIDRPKPSPEVSGGDTKLHSFVDHLWKYSQKTPLEIVADIFLRYPHLSEVARKFFDTYNKFLVLLDDSEKRKHLEELSRDNVASDLIYQDVRKLSHEIQDALTELFLKKNDTDLYELTKIYGVF